MIESLETTRSTLRPGAALRALLANAVDYAGLFPPAGLDLSTAVANYRAYGAGIDAWALGRFVLPAVRLAELAEVLERQAAPPPRPSFPIAALLAAAPAAGVTALEQWTRIAPRLAAPVEAVEMRVESVEDIRSALAVIPPSARRYLEVPLDGRLAAMLDEISQGGAMAKIRTGGVTPEAFPSPGDLLRFLRECAARRLAFKATAGLHHPWRGRYRLTYQAGAPAATMHGFVNLMLAASVCWSGGSPDLAREILLEESPSAFRLAGAALGWQGESFGAELLTEVRRDFLHGFGSCSFREPLDELAPGAAG